MKAESAIKSSGSVTRVANVGSANAKISRSRDLWSVGPRRMCGKSGVAPNRLEDHRPTSEKPLSVGRMWTWLTVSSYAMSSGRRFALDWCGVLTAFGETAPQSYSLPAFG